MPLTELTVPVPTLDDLPEIVDQILPDWATNLIQFTLQRSVEPLGPTIFDTVSDPTTSLGTDP